MFNDIQFANPELLWLFVLIPFLIIWFIFRDKKQNPSIDYSSAEILIKQKSTFKEKLRHLVPLLRLITLSLIIIIMARPQSSSEKRSVNTEGIDIVVAMDISTSMLAEDFKPNRLEAAKETAKQFVQERTNDRIGIVIFAGESFTQCPVTIDHDVLVNLFNSIETGKIKDGTAIGDGLATSVSRLKESKAKSRVIILMTDGVNNSGFISPETAAEISEQFGIRVYTIGVGTIGKAPYPFDTPFGVRYQNIDVKIDEDVLKKIAELTGGEYFRATDKNSLEKIYKKIDELEKTKIEVSYFKQYKEEYLPLAMLAIALLLLEILLNQTYLRRLP